MLAPHSYSCRDWYMNGNYLVILVSVIVILPLALMRQLGECGRAKALEGNVGEMPGKGPQSHSPSPTLQATWVTPAASLSAAWCSS